MTLSTRFYLIGIGIIIFVLAAPGLLLLAQGYGYDFETGQIIKTGTLVVKTRPRGATVYLNHEKLRNTPLVKRFLKPGEYEVEIKSELHKSWKKRVLINELQVSYLPEAEGIALLLAKPTKQILSATSSDFLSSGNNIFYLEENSIYRADYSGAKTLVASPKRRFVSPRIVDLRRLTNGKYEFLLRDEEAGWWHITSDTATALVPDLRDVKFQSAGELFYAITPENELVEFAITGEVGLFRENIQTYAMHNNSVYYLTLGKTPKLMQLSQFGSDTTILSDLPQSTSAQILITVNKQIFLVLDETLYEVGEVLRKVNQQVTDHLNTLPEGFLTYGNDNEIWLFDLVTQKNALLTRSTGDISASALNPETNYLFFAEHSALKALETDLSGQPNVYELAETDGPISKITINNDATKLVYLDGNSLILLQIR